MSGMMSGMKALTLWQPYATLWASGIKLVETRGWPTKFRGTMWVHAAVKNIHNITTLGPMTPDRFKAFQDAGVIDATGAIRPLPLGAVVGCVNIVDCVPIESLYGSKYDTPQEREFGDWSPGRFGWIADSPKAIIPSVPVKGAQGLWNWDPPTESMANGTHQLIRQYGGRWMREPGAVEKVTGDVSDGHFII